MRASPIIPYVVGQWVRGERFYGRTKQIAEILDGPRNCIWLLGTRRVGKTSLLKQLEYLTTEQERGYFPLFWDFQGAEDPQGLNLDFNDALYDAEDRLRELGIAVDEVEDENLFTSLGRLRRRLRSRRLTLLLLCDEAEELLHLRDKDPALLRRLHRAMQSQEGIRSVLASSMRLWALSKDREATSPFLHGFTPPLYLRNLDDADASSLVHQSQLPPESRPALDEGDVEKLCRRCDNHPYLLQLLAKRFVELGDLEEACAEVARDSMVSFFFSVDFDMLSDSERCVLATLRQAKQASSQAIESELGSDSGSAAGALQRLENLGFIRREADSRFRIASFFFRRWLAEMPAPAPARRPATRTAPPGLETTLSYEVRFEEIDGRYRLLEEAGKGANGVVFRAYDNLLRCEIAIKLLKEGSAALADGIARVRQEILLARDIGHPNILRIYDLGIFRNLAYLTMQWIDGTTLATRICEAAPIAAEPAVSTVAKLASALDAAHGRGVLHRDIKPGNVLLDDEREPYLCDFGLARLLEQPGLTAEGIYVGTPYYTSPEQASLAPLDERSDIYALGIVLFEMVTGRRPFEAASNVEVLDLQRSAPAPDPRQIEPEVPAEVAELILRCLDKEPARRPPSAGSLERELRSLGDKLPG